MADKTKNDPNLPRVFVYGSLKAGQPNNRALAGATYLGRCYLEGPYKMVSLGHFPGVIETGVAEDRNRILGEVYEVTEDVLHTLDLIEGHPSFYNRRKVATPWKNAWCYFLPREYLTTRQEVETGIWRATDAETEFMRGTNATGTA
jgi:gamma-glutamylaminecyclotransferase